MFRNIALAADGSPASGPAEKLAVELAGASHARLIAIHVIDPYPYLGIGDTHPMGFQAYMANAEAHAAHAHRRVAQLCEAGERVALSVRVVPAEPSRHA